MSILLYLKIGFFFSLFINLANDFLPEPKNITSSSSDNYNTKSSILLFLFYPFYILLFLLFLIKNMLEIRNKKK